MAVSKVYQRPYKLLNLTKFLARKIAKNAIISARNDNNKLMNVTVSQIELTDSTDTHIELYDEVISDADSKDEGLINAKPVDPNAIILSHALADKAINWRIHNCKVSEKTVTQELPLPFLYHYDSLDDSIKQANPLTPKLLLQFNTLMTANQAAESLGISKELISSPWHVKVTGSLVVFSEVLQLAVRLQWTNTGKATEQLYTKDAAEALVAAFKEWQFFGRVDVLYKNDKQALVSVDAHTASSAMQDEQVLTIDANTDYQYLPATHALIVIAQLEADKSELPWFEAAILERLE